MSLVKYLHLMSHQDGHCSQVMEMYVSTDACLLDSPIEKNIHIVNTLGLNNIIIAVR